MLKTKKFGLLVIVLLGMIGLVACNNEDINLFPETIELAIERAELAVATPGISIALVDVESGFTWTHGFGYANTLSGDPVTEDTMFMIASISKTFTAITVMQLVEEGLIDLDEPIVTYLPEFSILPHPTYGGNYRNITTRMLLNHTAGIPRDYGMEGVYVFDGHGLKDVYTVDGHYSGFWNTSLAYISELTMDFEEGTSVAYSNIGYGILGKIIARVSGYEDTFEGFLSITNENLFSPLGLTRSTYAIDDELFIYLAKPYRDHRTQHNEIIFINTLSSGAMYSTANNMAQLMQVILGDILNGDEQLLTQASFMEMIDFNFDHTTIFGQTFGLGFIHQINSENLETIGHDGSWSGYYSNMIFDLESGIGVFVAVNSDSARLLPTVLAEQILQRAIDEKLGN